jgi:hypothetical protein
MATVAVDCPNYELNLKMCPCTAEDCVRRGICCDCIAYHRASVQWPRTACMGGTPRPADTLDFPQAIPDNCPNSARNQQACVCTADNCGRHAVCCACVRNHWKADGSSATSCMRA